MRSEETGEHNHADPGKVLRIPGRYRRAIYSVLEQISKGYRDEAK